MKIINTHASEPSLPSSSARSAVPSGCHSGMRTVAELISKTHDIFSQPWPEPVGLPVSAHALVSINHRQEQQQQSQHFMSDQPPGNVQPPAEGRFEISSHFVHDNGPIGSMAISQPGCTATDSINGLSIGSSTDGIPLDLSTLNDWNAIKLLSSWIMSEGGD